MTDVGQGGGEYRGVPLHREQVEPLRTVEGDVPVAYRIGAVNDGQTAVSLGVGRTITVAADGLVRNASGTAIFRLERL